MKMKLAECKTTKEPRDKYGVFAVSFVYRENTHTHINKINLKLFGNKFSLIRPLRWNSKIIQIPHKEIIASLQSEHK